MTFDNAGTTQSVERCSDSGSPPRRAFPFMGGAMS
jgi:hypothetical protein